jgi:hypothetical protein
MTMATNNNNNNNSKSNCNSWFGMMDRLCGCSYIDAQLTSERETFRGRSTTIPTSCMKEADASPIIPRHHHPTFANAVVTPPGSPHQAKTHNATSSAWNDNKPPSSPTSSFATATTVTMRTRSVASVDTNQSIARQRTSSSLTTAFHPAPSFRRSQTEASHSDSFRRYEEEDEADVFHSNVLVSVAYDGDYDDDIGLKTTTSGTTLDPSFHRPRALRRVQTDSLTKLPPLAGYTSAERKSRRHGGGVS